MDIQNPEIVGLVLVGAIALLALFAAVISLLSFKLLKFIVEFISDLYIEKGRREAIAAEQIPFDRQVKDVFKL